MNKPSQRNRFRIFFGQLYYLMYKLAYWYVSGIPFASIHNVSKMEHLAASHSTPLFRKLAGVDMALQQNKVINLKIAIKKLDGLLIKPGETFSYWKSIGAVNRLKGYKPGLILQYGMLGIGIGGGLCQLSNLIFWMTLHTPLSIKERWRHSYDVFPDVSRTLPFGSGATCAYPYIDLQIYNGTTQSFQLSLKLSEEELIGEWLSSQPADYSYKIYESAHKFQSEPWGGYTRNNVLNRQVISKTSGKILEDAVILRNSAYVMYNPYLQNSALQSS